MNTFESLRVHDEISSLLEVFCEKGALRNLARFVEKYLYPRLVLIKLQTGNLKLFLKRDSNTGVFL